MLVLSRKKHEAIIIDDHIEIIVIDIRGDKVCLGITAPADIPVHREEVYLAIQEELNEQDAPVASDQSSSQEQERGTGNGCLDAQGRASFFGRLRA